MWSWATSIYHIRSLSYLDRMGSRQDMVRICIAEDIITSETVSVRPLNESDISEADRIFRMAFGTFLDTPEPETFAGDASFVTPRWRASPNDAIGAYLGGELVGSNFVTCWGSVGFFGPLSVRPDLWDQGVARKLMEATISLLDGHRIRLAGLFTFANSPKHIGLYHRFGFWPQHLTALCLRPVSTPVTLAWSKFSESSDGESAITSCAEITSALYPGLNAGHEIRAVTTQSLGDTILVTALDA